MRRATAASSRATASIRAGRIPLLAGRGPGGSFSQRDLCELFYDSILQIHHPDVTLVLGDREIELLRTNRNTGAEEQQGGIIDGNH